MNESTTMPRLLFALLAIGLSACTTQYERADRINERRVGANCETVSMSGNAETRSEAENIALNSVKMDAFDVRGNMIASGLRRIRVTQKDVRCRPFSLVPVRTECTATIVLCGRQ
jgi:hypothetical protein